MASPAHGRRSAVPASGRGSRLRALLPEILRFCTIGAIATGLDLGGAWLLHSHYHVNPLAAKAVSVTVSTSFTYLGCRFWTFRHRENQSLRREALLFIALNLFGLLVAEAVIAFVTYVLGLRGALAYNAASFVGTSLGTVFRYFAYRKWVFLAPAPEAAHAGGALRPGAPVLAEYPPWEPDPAYLVAEAVAADTIGVGTVTLDTIAGANVRLPEAAVRPAPARQPPTPWISGAALSGTGRHRKAS